MQDDDEIIAAHEAELVAEPPRRQNRRGFWVVVVAIGLVSVLIVAEIFVNRPLVSSIGRAQHDLRLAQERAERIFAASGSFDQAGAAQLAAAGGAVTFIPGDQAATEPGQVSVYASGTSWAAAAEARPNACFYIFERSGQDTRYGGGTVCSGQAALTGADQSEW